MNDHEQPLSFYRAFSASNVNEQIDGERESFVHHAGQLSLATVLASGKCQT